MLSALAVLLLNSFFVGLGLGSEGGFAKPLSPAKEKELVERFRSTRDIEARNTLVLHNMRLVAHVVKKYYSTLDEQDDLISIGTIGLIKAVDSFNPDKNIRLATFAARCIENEIFMYFRSLRRKGCEVSLSDALDIDREGNSIELLDVLSSDENITESVSRKEQVALLGKYVSTVLSDREKYIIERRYGLRGHSVMTQREIAVLCSISRSYVSRIEKAALDKLKNALG